MTSIIKVDNIQDQGGNNIINESGNVITIGASGDTITVPAGATVSGFTSAGIDDNATSVAITIDSNENVGIGTTSPNNYSGYGNLTLGGTSGGIFDLEVNGTRTGSLLGLVGETRLASITNIPVTFQVNNAEKMRLTSTGLGIFNSNPSTPIHISSNTPVITFEETDQSNRQFQIGSFGNAYAIYDATNTQYRYILDNSGNHIFNEGSQDCDFRVESNGNANMLFVDGGNDAVGIGTSSPSNILEIAGNGTPININSTNDEVKKIQFENSGSVVGYIGSSAGTPFRVLNGSASEFLRIDSSGNFFVATTTEASDDVGHALLASGAAYHTTDGTYAGLFNRKSSNGEVVQIRKDNTVVGKIGIETGGLTVDGEANHSGIMFSASSFLPRKNYSSADGTVDLGTTDGRWKDLYLGGGAFIGGTGTANKLDDFEIGTWTPSLQFGGGTTGIAYSQQFGNYTKIGRLVHIKMRVLLSNKGSSSGAAEITGFPFNAADDFTSVSFEKGQEVDTWNNMASASNYRFVFTDTGQMNFKKIDTNGTTSFGVNATDTDFNNASDLRITFTYTTT